MTVQDDDDSQKAPMRDRVRAEVRRILAGVTGWVRADTRRVQVTATKEAITTAVTGGLAVGIGVWATWRFARARLTHANMTQGSLIHPGIKTWIADEIGLIVGPLMSPTLPKNFHDEGIALANRWPVASFFTDVEVAEAHARFAATDWFTIHFEAISPNRNQANHYRFTPTAIAMLGAVTTAWFVGLAIAVQKGLEKAIP